jgi:hypothetical protein
LKVDETPRLKEPESENTSVRWVVADLTLEKQVLRDVAQGHG